MSQCMYSLFVSADFSDLAMLLHVHLGLFGDTACPVPLMYSVYDDTLKNLNTTMKNYARKIDKISRTSRMENRISAMKERQTWSKKAALRDWFVCGLRHEAIQKRLLVAMAVTASDTCIKCVVTPTQIGSEFCGDNALGIHHIIECGSGDGKDVPVITIGQRTPKYMVTVDVAGQKIGMEIDAGRWYRSHQCVCVVNIWLVLHSSQHSCNCEITKEGSCRLRGWLKSQCDISQK